MKNKTVAGDTLRFQDTQDDFFNAEPRCRFSYVITKEILHIYKKSAH